MVQDKSFSNVTIYDMEVTCGKHRPGMFPSQTWTCNDIRVNGMRMAYGYYPGLGADTRCTESGGFDELRQLCYKLMESIASNRQLWGAQVSNASCDYIEEKRVMLNLNLDGYYWKKMDPGYGWIETLQCVAFPKDDALSFPWCNLCSLYITQKIREITVYMFWLHDLSSFDKRLVFFFKCSLELLYC